MRTTLTTDTTTDTASGTTCGHAGKNAPRTIIGSARVAVAIAGIALLATACGNTTEDSAPASYQSIAAHVSETEVDVDEPSVGHISITAMRVGGSGDQSPRVEGVPFRVLPIGSESAVLTGATKNRADRNELAPGNYRVVADRSAVPSGPCSGEDEIMFSISPGEDVIVATYIPEVGFDQIPSPFCMRLVTLPTG